MDKRETIITYLVFIALTVGFWYDKPIWLLVVGILSVGSVLLLMYNLTNRKKKNKIRNNFFWPIRERNDIVFTNRI